MKDHSNCWMVHMSFHHNLPIQRRHTNPHFLTETSWSTLLRAPLLRDKNSFSSSIACALPSISSLLFSRSSWVVLGAKCAKISFSQLCTAKNKSKDQWMTCFPLPGTLACAGTSRRAKIASSPFSCLDTPDSSTSFLLSTSSCSATPKSTYDVQSRNSCDGVSNICELNQSLILTTQ